MLKYLAIYKLPNLYIYFLFLICSTFAKTTNIQIPDNENSFLKQNLFFEHEKNQSGSSIVDKVSEILKFLDLKNSKSVKMLMELLSLEREQINSQPLVDIYSVGEFPELESTAADFLQLMKKDAVELIKEKLDNSNALSVWKKLASLRNSTIQTKDKPVVDADQCYRDANTLFDPITGRIASLLGAKVCDKLPKLLRDKCREVASQKENATFPEGALKMIDAAGKIPPGLLEGKLAWVGAYELCENDEKVSYNSTNQTLNTFLGKYCRIQFQFQKTSVIHLNYGLCMPSSCDSTAVTNYFTEENILISLVLNYVLNWTISEVYCGQESIHASTDGALITSLTILVTLVLFIIAATIYDWFFRCRIIKNKFVKNPLNLSSETVSLPLNLQKEKISLRQRMELFVVSFSLYTNWRRLFNTNRKPEQIKCLDGFRFLSFIYLILGQTYLFGPIYTEIWLTSNMATAVPAIVQKLYMQPILNYNLCEDSFLVISGVLITYWALHKYGIQGRNFTWKSGVYFIAHRYIRLMPALALGIMAYTCTYRYVANGPLYPSSISDADNCRYNWWTVVFMVHNLVDVHNMCFGHIWATSLLFQLHLVSLIVVIGLIFKRWIGYLTLFALYLIHIICVSLISNSIRSEGAAGLERWYYEYLMTPWCRAGPFLIGMACGIFIKNNVNIFRHKVIEITGWILSIVTLLLVSCSSWMQFKEGGTLWNKSQHVAYDTLARSAWGLACSYIIYACHLGYGGGVNKFLGYRVFRPLSRLVFPSLVVSAMTIFTYAYTLRYPMYVDTFNMLYLSFGHICMCLIYGTMASLGWQLPFAINLERTLMYKNLLQWVHAAAHPHELCILDCARTHRESLIYHEKMPLNDSDYYSNTAFKSNLSSQPLEFNKIDNTNNPKNQNEFSINAPIISIENNQTANKNVIKDLNSSLDKNTNFDSSIQTDNINNGPIRSNENESITNFAFVFNELNERVHNGEPLSVRLRTMERSLVDNINSHVNPANPKWLLKSEISVESDRLDLLGENDSTLNSEINSPIVIEKMPNFEINK